LGEIFKDATQKKDKKIVNPKFEFSINLNKKPVYPKDFLNNQISRCIKTLFKFNERLIGPKTWINEG